MTGHTLTLENDFADDGDYAVCSCGWVGEACPSVTAAVVTFDDHIAAVVARTEDTR